MSQNWFWINGFFDWISNWHEFFKPITKYSNAKPKKMLIIFDTQEKTALSRNQVICLTAAMELIIFNLVSQKFLVEKYSVKKFPSVIVIHRRGTFQELSQ